MSGASKSPMEVAPCNCEENLQFRHAIKALHQQLKSEQVAMKGELQSAIQEIAMVTERVEKEWETKQALQAEYDRLKTDQQKFLFEEFRSSQEIEELADLDREALKEMSDANVQTEDFGDLEDECAVNATIALEVFGRPYQQLKNELAAKEGELRSATQKVATITESLEIELEAKQALQAEYDRDQQKSHLAELRNKQEIEELKDLYRKAAEQNEKLSDEIGNRRLVKFASGGVLAQSFLSFEDSLEQEANAKQNKIDQMIASVQKKQEPKTFGRFKPLLVAFLVSVIVAFFATLACISVDSTDPNDLYDRRQYI